MCGIIGAVARRDVAPILMDGLRRLEYRGYDSAGLAVVGDDGLQRVRTAGKVADLETKIGPHPPAGFTGIAHTRWATHGAPNETNAHPLVCGGEVAVVHNGIIENHAAIRAELAGRGYRFDSDTDTEAIGQLIRHHLSEGRNLPEAVRRTVKKLTGSYAFAAMSAHEPDRIVASARGSPLVIGVGVDEHFIASDSAALLAVTHQYQVLEDGDVAELTTGEARVSDRTGRPAERPLLTNDLSLDMVDRGNWRHFMQKEIHEQPRVVAAAAAGRSHAGQVLDETFGGEARAVLDEVRAVQIVACGTSYHAGLVARHWFEGLAGVPCQVEVASEFRYREPAVQPGTLLVAISQSGETADTLGAVREARKHGGFGAALGIVNTPGSSLTRDTELVLTTNAGPEIGVASTKAFTTQLTTLLLLVAAVGRRHRLTSETEARLIGELEALPGWCEEALALEPEVEKLSEEFTHAHHALFLGRGVYHPVAMEGALKLKEISYIHAESYPAGELKHGPLALVDEDMPVVAVSPNDALLEKLHSNLEEVHARGGRLYVFGKGLGGGRNGVRTTAMPAVGEIVAPVVYTIPLQLLAYHVAVLKGTDVDQPRNLAKSVTVE